MKKHNFGFTLVEMLVVLAIMGLILIMAFPAVNQLIKRNSNKKYVYHEQAMIEAAKLYLDQYEADFVGIGWSGCVEINYQTLLDSKLLKQFQEENIKCNISGNKVRITKENDKTSFQAYLECQDQDTENKIVYKSDKTITGTCTASVPSSSKAISKVLFDEKRIGDNCSISQSGTLTSLQGNCSNNYVWYSGKLWRVISTNSSNNTVRLITQWNISTIKYTVDSSNSQFSGSYASQWLNENFKNTLKISSDSTSYLSEPSIQLLSKEELSDASFLCNQLSFGIVNETGDFEVSSQNCPDSENMNMDRAYGIRPVISLKGDTKIVTGSGTADHPYRLKGDNDKPSPGTLLNTRLSGEYVMFSNQLYRIVNVEYEKTKIVRIDFLSRHQYFEPTSTYTSTCFDVNNDGHIGKFLNSSWTEPFNVPYNGMVTKELWIIKLVNSNYIVSGASAKIGLPMLGEMFAGQFDIASENKPYWTLTPDSSTCLNFYVITSKGEGQTISASSYYNYIRPMLYLDRPVRIQSGTGLPNDPFILTQ